MRRLIDGAIGSFPEEFHELEEVIWVRRVELNLIHALLERQEHLRGPIGIALWPDSTPLVRVVLR